MTFSHSRASRSACDSLVLQISDGSFSGYGEVVLREYVNDLEGVYRDTGDVAGRMKEILVRISRNGSELPDIEDLRSGVLSPNWEARDLPLLAAVEGGLLDLLCQKKGVDVYKLLDREPLREDLRYGGVMPIMPEVSMKKMLAAYRGIGIRNLRIKLSGDASYNRKTLQLVREVLGKDFDIRVDVNCAWTRDDALAFLDLLSESGISLVEEPLGPGRDEMMALVQSSAEYSVVYVADESAVTFEDLDGIVKDGTFGMLNLRLAKNGGLLRVLEMAERADQAGLRYQLGCHVGETGILSMTGRTAAALMSRPEYVDGSFDEYLLSENITEENYTFGPGGKAPVIRNNGMGYKVDRAKLARNSTKKFLLM